MVERVRTAATLEAALAAHSEGVALLQQRWYASSRRAVPEPRLTEGLVRGGGTRCSFLTPDADRIRSGVDALVGLIVHTFAVADAYVPASDAVLTASGRDARNALQLRLIERILQSQERYQRGFDALVGELLERTRHEQHPHFEELLTRLHG